MQRLGENGSFSTFKGGTLSNQKMRKILNEFWGMLSTTLASKQTKGQRLLRGKGFARNSSR